MIQQYPEKDFIIDRLIKYLKNELNFDYFRYKVSDIDGNTADIIVKKNSEIFKNTIENQQYIKFNVEELIDKRMFSNDDEIIIIDINFDEGLINLEYLCDSLNYNYLSYSNDINEKLSIFSSYVIRKANNWY